jgi:hypothetical protein
VQHDRIAGNDSQGNEQSYTVDIWMMSHLLNESIKQDDIRKHEHYSKTDLEPRHTASLTCG